MRRLCCQWLLVLVCAFVLASALGPVPTSADPASAGLNATLERECPSLLGFVRLAPATHHPPPSAHQPHETHLPSNSSTLLLTHNSASRQNSIAPMLFQTPRPHAPTPLATNPNLHTSSTTIITLQVHVNKAGGSSMLKALRTLCHTPPRRLHDASTTLPCAPSSAPHTCARHHHRPTHVRRQLTTQGAAAAKR